MSKMTQLRMTLSNLSTDTNTFEKEWASTNNNCEEIEDLLEKYATKQKRSTNRASKKPKNNQHNFSTRIRTRRSRRASV